MEKRILYFIHKLRIQTLRLEKAMLELELDEAELNFNNFLKHLQNYD
jgi:hypothetical protein